MRGHIAEKNGRYYPVISEKDPATGEWKRKWLTGHRTKREAEKARAEAVAQVNRGMPIMPCRETVAKLCRDFLTTTAPNRIRPITLQSYQQMLNKNLISKVGAKPAVSLTPDDLNFIMAEMVREGKSVTTARYLLRIVHRVLEDAVKKGRLYRNVADLADPPPEEHAEGEVWDEKQFDLFLTAAANWEYYQYFATLALTGIRRGEGLGLQWCDADLNITSPTLHIRRTAYKLDNGEWRFEKPKTKRSDRVIALPISLALLLQRMRDEQEANAEWCGRQFSINDFIFVRPDGSLPDPRYLSKVFQRIVEGAGLKRIRLHDLRHTCATLLRKSGQPIEVISKMLGHASILVTLKIYDHWEGELRAPADAMDNMLEKVSRNQNEEAFVRKTLEEGDGVEREPCGSRTHDHLIKSQVLYQLS